jgi:hypothetical protein
MHKPMAPTAQRDQVFRPVRFAGPLHVRVAGQRGQLRRRNSPLAAALDGFAENRQPIRIIGQSLELMEPVVEAQRLGGVQLQAGVAELAIRPAARHLSEPQPDPFSGEDGEEMTMAIKWRKQGFPAVPPSILPNALQADGPDELKSSQTSPEPQVSLRRVARNTAFVTPVERWRHPAGIDPRRPNLWTTAGRNNLGPGVWASGAKFST